MKIRKLGKTGMDVSEIGMGCWQFGGDFGPTEDSTSIATMKAASTAGVTLFDTADVYGDGRSERVIGGYSPGAPAALHVITKVGRRAELFPDNYAYADVRAQLLESCENLGVDALELVQLHCVPPAQLASGEVFAVMDRLQSEGVCKNWGASVETIEEAQLCLKHGSLATLQIIFNIFRQTAATALFADAKAANVGIIVRLPLASGLLAGKYTPQTKFAESDHRNYNADGAAFSVGETFSGIPFAKALDCVELIRPLVPEGVTMAEFSLRWILDHDAVSTVIAGCSSAAQVAANARASAMPPLPPQTHAALRDIYETTVKPLVRGAI